MLDVVDTQYLRNNPSIIIIIILFIIIIIVIIIIIIIIIINLFIYSRPRIIAVRRIDLLVRVYILNKLNNMYTFFK